MADDVAGIRPARADEAEAVLGCYEWLFEPPGSIPPGWEPLTAVERIGATIAGSSLIFPPPVWGGTSGSPGRTKV